MAGYGYSYGYSYAAHHAAHHIYNGGFGRNPTPQTQDYGNLTQSVNTWNSDEPNFPQSALIVIGVTVLVGILIACAVDYTLYSVVGNLACVESPQSEVIIADKDKDAQAGTDAEIIVINHKPITSKIRGTLRHLTSIGGWTARWRGLSMSIAYNLVFGLVNNFFTYLCTVVLNHLPFGSYISFAKTGLSYVLAAIVLASWDATHTHIVISNPSSKYWFQRLPPRKTWKNVWKATAVQAGAWQIVGCMLIVCASTMTEYEQQLREGSAVPWIIIAGTILAATIACVGIVIPATIALIRVQASTLSDEDEAIVPFDRTFGGKVIPEILGGSGSVGVRDAWKTFDGASRRRIISLLAKFICIDFAVGGLIGLVLGVEVAAFMNNKEVRGFLLNVQDKLNTL